VRERSIVRAGGSLPFVAERDLWWASLGQNEERSLPAPVIILWKLAHEAAVGAGSDGGEPNEDDTDAAKLRMKDTLQRSGAP
jgi:hypothetical protein